MRNFKRLILMLLILPIISVKASIGICDGKPMKSDGYCTLDKAVNVQGVTVGTSGKIGGKTVSSFKQKFNWDNINQSGTKYPQGITAGPQIRYYALEDNNVTDLYCIDANLSFSTNPYKEARPIIVNGPKASKFDVSIAKAYQQYMKHINSSGKSYEAAAREDSQIMYAVARAITAKSGLNIKTHIPSSYSKLPAGQKALINKFVNEYEKYNKLPNQINKNDFSKPTRYRLVVGRGGHNSKNTMKLLRDWYNFGISSKTKLQKFDLDVKILTEDIKPEDRDGTKFSKVVPVEVSGLKQFTKDGFKGDLKPSVKLSDIILSNKSVNWETKPANLLNKDIIELSKGSDKYKFEIVIKGNISKEAEEETLNVKLKFDKKHPMDPDSLVLLRPAQKNVMRYQRMLWLRPFAEVVVDKDIKTTIPSKCERIHQKDGSDIYKVDGKEVGLEKYLDEGCCSVSQKDLHALDNDKLIIKYMDGCAVGDMLFLQNDCVNRPPLPNDEENGAEIKSWVKQESMDQILKVLNNFDEEYINSIDSAEANVNLSDNYNKTNGYLDDLYMEDLISKDNNYCQMFVSEDIDITYPGTIETVSGRYFKLRNNPKIESKANATFRIARARLNADKHNATTQAQKDLIAKYEQECEKAIEIKENWEYSVNPKLTFYYKANVYDKEEAKTFEKISAFELEQIENKPSCELKPGGTADLQTITCESKIEFRPQYKYILPISGRVVTSKVEAKDTNALDLGNVLTVDVTNTKGEYYTWFKLENLGHKFSQTDKYKDNNDKPNVQALVENYVKDNEDLFITHDPNKEFFEENEVDFSYLNACEYKNIQQLITPPNECPPEDKDGNKKKCQSTPQYYFRSISIDNVNPQEKKDTNWSNGKGVSAKERIEELGDGVYSDEYLEYSFTISPENIYTFKKDGKAQQLQDDLDKCHGGKECESKFLSQLADISESNGNKKSVQLLNDTRKGGWKYYVNEKWITGSIAEKTIDGLGEKYPDANDYEKQGFTYWP